MKFKPDELYKHLPRPLQNVALTIYGHKQTRFRYGNKLPDDYERLLSGGKHGTDDVRQFQERRFAALLSHAAKYVPFYRDFFSRNRLSATEVNISNSAALLPIVGKQDILKDPAAFQSEYYQSLGLRLFTSGTTGSPMEVLCTREARSLNYAFHRKILRKHGCDIRDRKVTLAGRVLFSRNERSIFWRKDYSNRTLYCSTYHLAPATLPSYLKAIEEWQPKFIDSYPSAILQLSAYMNQNGISLDLPLKFILTSSETLTAEHRNEIEKAFGVEVVDQYGCTEMAVMAYTHLGTYEIDPLYSFVELQSLAGTDDYSLICTGLVNFGMPLIRYRIGDVVTQSASARSQAQAVQTFASIVGRQDDYITTPEGRKIGRMDPAFKGVTGVQQAQIVQNDVQNLDLLLVVIAGANFDDIARTLTENILARTSRSMSVTVKRVDSIPLSKSGKFKAVVSKVTD